MIDRNKLIEGLGNLIQLQGKGMKFLSTAHLTAAMAGIVLERPSFFNRRAAGHGSAPHGRAKSPERACGTTRPASRV
jgi:hypothetical protein